MVLRVGIDTGGTFTDLIGVVQNEQSEVSGRLIVTKRPSTPRHPEAGVFETLAGSGISPSDIGSLILGSTMAINMLHTRSGARVLYLTTQGFEDVLFIQRINRRFHYDLDWVKPAPFAERRDCLGVRERITKDGDVLIPLDEQELARLRAVVTERLAEGAADDRPAAIAINLLFSYVNPRHEQELAAFLQRELPDVPVSLSHAVAPIWREYERGSTTVADAYIKPHVAAFAGNLDRGFRERGLEAPWALMKSNGGTMLPAAAPQQAVQLLLSGLAGGIIAGRYFGDLVGMAGHSRTDGASKVITFDMGGTSTDVGLVIDGEYGYTTEYQVEWGIPVAAPFIDITTIGAGGGSLAWVDKGGFLKVGPQSAGADPGPACYDAGGTEATVTDANLVLGRLNPDYFLAGTMALNRDRASAAVATMVFRQFPGEAEGELSLRFTKLVRNETLTEIALELGIDRFIVIGKGEELNGMRRSPSILADIMEALIGALYLDGGFAMADAFVRTCWQDRVASGTGTGRDGKTQLQEWALERGLALPGYRVLDKTGPSHAPLITVEVCIEGFECVQAQGRSRRAAERQAAETFLAGMAC